MESSVAAHIDDFDASLIPAVSAIVSGRVKEELPGASVTTFAIGGPLRVVVTVESESELAELLSVLSASGQVVRVLGFGSNLLIADHGFCGWVIRLGGEFKGVASIDNGKLQVGGAASLMALARRVSDDGLSGLEFAAGIPASIGGAIFMNAGAHGAEIGERVVSISGVLPHGVRREWQRDELAWRYRSSGLPPGMIVTSVQLSLAPGDRGIISKQCAENLAHRRATQPLALPSAGSVFKNPSPTLPAGRVLEAAGMKGVEVGAAKVSELHANWIVNPQRRATAWDVQGLISLCQTRALSTAGVELEPEIRFWE